MKGVDKGAIPVGTDMRPVQTGGISTSLMEIVGVVAEEVNGIYPDEDQLVTRVVFGLLGGRGDPVPGMTVRVLKRHFTL